MPIKLIAKRKFNQDVNISPNSFDQSSRTSNRRCCDSRLERLTSRRRKRTQRLTPRKRRQLDTAWQVDRANTWQVIKLSKGFELFSYYGEDSTAAKIVELIPALLLGIKEKDLRQKSNEDGV